MTPTPPFTDEHEQLRESIRRFVATELRPYAAAWEAAHWFPDDQRRARGGARALRAPKVHPFGRAEPHAQARCLPQRRGWGLWMVLLSPGPS